MSDYEAKIKTKFGELTIHFTDKADLENKLAKVTELSEAIVRGVGPIIASEAEKVPEYADLYTNSPDGLIKLLKYPKKKTDLLRLAAFLSPRALNPTQLRQISGVSKPLDYMGEDFIRNSDGTYSLGADGKLEVANKIIPKLRGEKK